MYKGDDKRSTQEVSWSSVESIQPAGPSLLSQGVLSAIRTTISSCAYPEQSGCQAKTRFRPPEAVDTVIMKQQAPVSPDHLPQGQEETQI